MIFQSLVPNANKPPVLSLHQVSVDPDLGPNYRVLVVKQDQDQEEPEGPEQDAAAPEVDLDSLIVKVPFEDGRRSSRPYRCAKCDYRSARKDTLVNHLASVHVGARRHSCQECGFRTARRGTLVRHVRVVHRDLKPHVCEVTKLRIVFQNLRRRQHAFFP